MHRYRESQFVIDMTVTQSPSSSSIRPTAEWLDDAIFYGTMGLLMSGVLLFGSTEGWGQFVQRTAALVLFALWGMRQYLRGEIELPRSPLYLPAFTFVGIIVLQFITGATGYRYATLEEALNLIPAGVLLLLSGGIFSRRQKLHDLVLVMAIFGFCIALFALTQDLLGADKIYWLVGPREDAISIYGPYINRNHYAGLMEMLAPLAGAAAFLECGAKRNLLLFAATMMVVSIVFSRSRGGMLGLAVAMIFLSMMLFRMTRRYRTLLLTLAIAAAVVVVVLLLANGKTLQRLTETQDHYRLAIYKDCIGMWLHKPLFGFGWGTFPTIYPEYRSFFTNLRVNHAHNDYLELLVEMGLAGIAIVGWFLIGVFREGFRKILTGNDEKGTVLTLGALTGVVALLAHSALDFNLHIAANAAMFYVLCSAAATPFRHRVREPEVTSFEEDEEEPIIVNSPA